MIATIRLTRLLGLATELELIALTANDRATAARWAEIRSILASVIQPLRQLELALRRTSP